MTLAHQVDGSHCTWHPHAGTKRAVFATDCEIADGTDVMTTGVRDGAAPGLFGFKSVAELEANVRSEAPAGLGRSAALGRSHRVIRPGTGDAPSPTVRPRVLGRERLHAG